MTYGKEQQIDLKIHNNFSLCPFCVLQSAHCVKYRNFTKCPGVEILWKVIAFA